MTEVAPAFQKIRVPLHWAGYTRRLRDGSDAFACGACPNTQACVDSGVCSRASDEDFARVGLRPRGDS